MIDSNPLIYYLHLASHEISVQNVIRFIKIIFSNNWT